MPLIKNGAVHSYDWTFAEKAEDLLSNGNVIVEFYTFIEAGEAVFCRNGGIGVALPNDADLGLLSARLERIGLLTVDFPGFADGRGFSLARELRHTYKFTGEIWASGHLIPDQYIFARQCGFDAVHVDKMIFARQSEACWRQAAVSPGLRYQASHGDYAGAPQSILALRKAARTEAVSHFLTAG